MKKDDDDDDGEDGDDNVDNADDDDDEHAMTERLESARRRWRARVHLLTIDASANEHWRHLSSETIR